MKSHDIVLPHQLVQRGRERPDRLATVEIDGRSRDYGQACRDVAAWADGLRRLGVAEGDRVVTMLPNSFEAYDSWLGIGWLRALEVPVNNMHRGEMLRYVIGNSEAGVIVISERFVDRLAEVLADLPLLHTVVVPDATGPLPELPLQVVGRDAVLADGPEFPEGPGPEIYDISSIIYTSGTTGPSKGVLVPWGELAGARGFTPPGFVAGGEPYYSTFPPFHLGGKAVFCGAIDVGAHVVQRETFSASKFWDDLRDHNVHSAALLGPVVSMLQHSPPGDDDLANPLTSVITAPVPPDIDAFKLRFGVDRVASGFGMTEVGFLLSTGWDAPNWATCGQVVADGTGREVKIVDEHDHEVATGEVGELVVRAWEPWCLNAGYWRMPEATATAWRNGWFHTGDGFRRDADGWFYFVDRMKDALRRRGENISRFEVESGINAHPDVVETAVIGVPSELGEDDVKAVIVLREGAALEPGALIEFLTTRMSRHMIPRYVEYVSSLPKTEATMRVRKVDLRADALNAATWDRDQAQ